MKNQDIKEKLDKLRNRRSAAKDRYQSFIERTKEWEASNRSKIQRIKLVDPEKIQKELLKLRNEFQD